MFERLGLGPIEIDDLNNLICRIGRDTSPSLLIMAYTTSQHGNYTDPTLEGRIVDGRDYGIDGKCVIGKGTSQNKGASSGTVDASISNLPFKEKRGIAVSLNWARMPSGDLPKP
jgi:hypothetical protein